jgi:hypothetical protein
MFTIECVVFSIARMLLRSSIQQMPVSPSSVPRRHKRSVTPGSLFRISLFMFLSGTVSDICIRVSIRQERPFRAGSRAPGNSPGAGISALLHSLTCKRV